jgi:hypothetical protein
MTRNIAALGQTTTKVIDKHDTLWGMCQASDSCEWSERSLDKPPIPINFPVQIWWTLWRVQHHL